MKTAHVKKTGGFRAWFSLPATIRSKKIQAQETMIRIQDEFILYRLHSDTYDYFATRTDRCIDDQYSWIQRELKKLASMEKDLYFRMFSFKALRNLDARLDELINNEVVLEEQIHKAPQAFDFYNKMSVFKDIHHHQVQEEMEVARILNKARKNLDQALIYIKDYEKGTSGNTPGTSILNNKDIRKYLDQKLKDIQTMEDEKCDPAILVMEIENLARMLFDVPVMAQWVNAVENRFNRLASDHKLLVEFYEKRIIQKEILEEFTSILYTAIPRLWSTGQKDQLEQHLTELDTFINTYKEEVESEIAFTERHVRKEVIATEVSQKLIQLSELARIFIAAMDSRDPTMNTHSLTVARLAVATSKQMNWKVEDIQYLEIAALLHDVGKIWIPETLLTKKTKLNQDDITKLRMHPVYGAQILQSSELFAEITPWIYHHQELWDGSGYPDGLKEADIPLQSRIISICEAFAAMLSGTPTKSPLTVDQALDRIRYEAGKLFDPVLVESFVTAVETQEIDYLKKYVEK